MCRTSLQPSYHEGGRERKKNTGTEIENLIIKQKNYDWETNEKSIWCLNTDCRAKLQTERAALGAFNRAVMASGMEGKKTIQSRDIVWIIVF